MGNWNTNLPKQGVNENAITGALRSAVNAHPGAIDPDYFSSIDKRLRAAHNTVIAKAVAKEREKNERLRTAVGAAVNGPYVLYPLDDNPPESLDEAAAIWVEVVDALEDNHD